MAWRRICDKPLSEPMMSSVLTYICLGLNELALAVPFWADAAIDIGHQSSEDDSLILSLNLMSVIHGFWHLIRYLCYKTYIFLCINIKTNMVIGELIDFAYLYHGVHLIWKNPHIDFIKKSKPPEFSRPDCSCRLIKFLYNAKMYSIITKHFTRDLNSKLIKLFSVFSSESWQSVYCINFANDTWTLWCRVMWYRDMWHLLRPDENCS